MQCDLKKIYFIFSLGLMSIFSFWCLIFEVVVLEKVLGRQPLKAIRLS